MNNIILGISSLILCSLSFSKIEDPNPERFSESFQKFASIDHSSRAQTKDLTLFTGSSSIRMWESLQSDFSKINLINRGFGGAHLSDVLYYYDQLFKNYRPKRIVIYCGENDLWSGKPVVQVMGNFHTLWAKIKKDLPSTTLIYLSCKPSPKRISKWNTYQALNLRIKNFCLRNSNLTYVDLSPTLLRPNFTFDPRQWDPDELHVNQNGYQSWTNWLRPILLKK